MKRLVATLFVFAVAVLAGYVLPSGDAHASENAIGCINDGGVGTQTFTPGNAPSGQQWTDITFQCINQEVYVRAGCSGCAVDAGVGDLVVNFSAPDTYPFPLEKTIRGQNSIHIRRTDAGVINCCFFEVAQ